MDECIKLFQSLSDQIPVQKSSDWLNWRKTRSTGTDAYTLFSNSVESFDNLVLKKVDQVRIPFLGNEYTRHGEFYEDVAIAKYEKLFQRKAYAINGLEHAFSNYLAFSPDGIVFLPTEIILLEVKCPFKRKITNTIPTSYKYQCQQGMEIIASICEKYNYHVDIYTHFIEFKPINFGYINDEIFSVKRINRSETIGKQLCERAENLFSFIHSVDKNYVNGFLEE